MRLPLTLPLSLIAVLSALVAGPTYAQNTRSWVSNTGADNNSCTLTSPCRTLPGAIAKTMVGGEVDCLGPTESTTFTITQSITVDCHGSLSGVDGTNIYGIVVDYGQFAGSDTARTVNLRNITINGLAVGTTGINLRGPDAETAGSYVNIENCVIDGQVGANNSVGIFDDRGRGTLTVNHTIVRNIGANGIIVFADSGGSHRVTINDTQVTNAGGGIAVGINSDVMVVNSLVSSNLSVGLIVNPGGQMVVRGSTIAHNTMGMQVSGSLTLDSSNVSFNSIGSTGTINSFSNNAFVANGAFGPIVPIGTTSNPTGLR